MCSMYDSCVRLTSVVNKLFSLSGVSIPAISNPPALTLRQKPVHLKDQTSGQKLSNTVSRMYVE